MQPLYATRNNYYAGVTWNCHFLGAKQNKSKQNTLNSKHLQTDALSPLRIYSVDLYNTSRPCGGRRVVTPRRQNALRCANPPFRRPLPSPPLSSLLLNINRAVHRHGRETGTITKTTRFLSIPATINRHIMRSTIEILIFIAHTFGESVVKNDPTLVCCTLRSAARSLYTTKNCLLCPAGLLKVNTPAKGRG